MENKLAIKRETLTEIADAIRERNNLGSPIETTQMANLISNINKIGMNYELTTFKVYTDSTLNNAPITHNFKNSSSFIIVDKRYLDGTYIDYCLGDNRRRTFLIFKILGDNVRYIYSHPTNVGQIASSSTNTCTFNDTTFFFNSSSIMYEANTEYSCLFLSNDSFTSITNYSLADSVKTKTFTVNSNVSTISIPHECDNIPSVVSIMPDNISSHIDKTTYVFVGGTNLSGGVTLVLDNSGHMTGKYNIGNITIDEANVNIEITNTSYFLKPDILYRIFIYE